VASCSPLEPRPLQAPYLRFRSSSGVRRGLPSPIGVCRQVTIRVGFFGTPRNPASPVNPQVDEGFWAGPEPRHKECASRAGHGTPPNPALIERRSRASAKVR
jgi:hypothetical protein